MKTRINPFKAEVCCFRAPPIAALSYLKVNISRVFFDLNLKYVVVQVESRLKGFKRCFKKLKRINKLWTKCIGSKKQYEKANKQTCYYEYDVRWLCLWKVEISTIKLWIDGLRNKKVKFTKWPKRDIMYNIFDKEKICKRDFWVDRKQWGRGIL